MLQVTEPAKDYLDRAVEGDERGQGLAEYALILALIAIVSIVALVFLGTQISRIINEIGGSM